MFRRVLAFLLVVSVSPVWAEYEISLMTGNAWTASSDVTVSTPDGAHRYRDVDWHTKSTEMPPYYALRYTHWPDATSAWGWSIDFLHAKMISDADQVLNVDRLLNDNSAAQSVRLGDDFSRLEFSDGHNLLTANFVRRWNLPLAGEHRKPWRVHASMGGGIAVPHVEVTWGGGETRGYQFAGPAAQAMAGVSVPLSDRWTIGGEMRISWAAIDASLHDGMRLATDAWTRHLTLNIGYSFGRLATMR